MLIQNTRVRFSENPHSYFLDNTRELIGVTSLMRKHGLAHDYSGIKEDVMNAAAERGSKIHKDIELYCKGEAVEMTPELKAYIKLGIQPLANEYLVSDNEIVASMIDIVSTDNDIIDVKTTTNLYIEPLQWQLSIYAYLFELQTGLKANKLYGLHIKDKKAKLVEIRRIDSKEIEHLLECEKYDLPFIPTSTELPSEIKQELLKLKDAMMVVSSIKEQLKVAEMAEKALKEHILSVMEDRKENILECEGVKITYVAPTIRESIDKDALQENYPDIYKRYIKIVNVSPTIRVSLKK
jgi:CRISPR/Cas system-associated exonuclease Cas4 (RecB family)